MDSQNHTNPKLRPNPGLKLLDQVREVLRYYRYAERWRSPAAGSGGAADAGGSQVQRFVYAQHGRELMGLKSPVRAPPCSRREDTGSTSRRQLLPDLIV